MGAKQFLSKLERRAWAYAYQARRDSISLDDQMVLFFTFQGAYTCNPKYICEALLRRNPALRCVWVTLEDNASGFPEDVETVVFGSQAYYEALYRAKVWVDNAFNFTKQPLEKKPGQYYVETMHGSLGIKRIGPEANADPKRNARGFRCAEMNDYIISNSSFETMVYRTSFWKDTPILELGHARNDILITDHAALTAELHRKVRRFYGLDDSAKLALYAPTFQREQQDQMEALDPALLRAALEKRFGGDWYVLERLHPRDARNHASAERPAHVLDGNAYTDIQELMAAIDFGITDYSSWIFDYVLTGKPGLLYAPDLEAYANSTGFYYPITEAPFPAVTDNEGMTGAIRDFSMPAFSASVDRFLHDRGCVDDGAAAEKAAELILGLLRDELPGAEQLK